MQTSPSIAERLKARLVGCLDRENNVIDMGSIATVLEELENAAITKEALELTRLGALVNDLRRKLQQSSPDLSKRCRSIIRAWQKLCAQVSNASSVSTGAAIGGESNSAGVSPVSLSSEDSGARRLVTPKSLHQRLMTSSLDKKGRISSTPSLVTYEKQKMAVSLTKSITPVMTLNGHHHWVKSSSTGSTKDEDASATAQRDIINSVVSVKPEPVMCCSVVKEIVDPDTATVAPPSLKIRIKMGGLSTESASIIKSRSVPCDLNTNMHNNAICNQENRTFMSNGTTAAAADQALLPTVVENIDEVPNIVSAKKKPRQKRTIDQMADRQDPLLMISQGLPLPKLKSTADLVAEMASVYPEEMARSITSAATNVFNVIQMDKTSDDVTYHKRAYQCTNGTTLVKVAKLSSPALSKYAKHDDYLDLTKAELVAKYLKTSNEQQFAQDSPPPISPDDQKSNVESGLKLKPGSNKLKQESILNLIVKPRRDWYSMLKPVDQSVDWFDQQSSDNDVLKIVASKFLDDTISNDTPGLLAKCVSDSSAIDLHSRILITMGDLTKSINTDSALVQQSHQTTDNSGRLTVVPVIAMPYVDIGLPDFLQYKYPEQQRHLAHWSER